MQVVHFSIILFACSKIAMILPVIPSLSLRVPDAIYFER